jgi:formate dehydrogenase major subunit
VAFRTRVMPHTAELQPEAFVEISPELARALGITHLGWTVLSSLRGEIEVRAMVTERMRPFVIDNRIVHEIGMPWVFGREGYARGAVANVLLAITGDANTSIHSTKATTCNIRRPICVLEVLHMAAEYPGHIALRAIDDVLAQKPHKDDSRLSTATGCLCVFRDHVIDANRGPDATGEGRKRLAHLNSVLSVVLGCQFPLGDVPWQELERARGWLADLVSEMEPRVESTTAPRR